MVGAVVALGGPFVVILAGTDISNFIKKRTETFVRHLH
jgi:hypothetical protein